MIHSFHIVDGKTGYPLLEHYYRNTIARDEDFFQAVDSLIDDIRNNIRNIRKIADFSRILMIQDSILILHFQAKSQLLFSALSDIDDAKKRLLTTIQSIARRFCRKYFYRIEEFRISHDMRIFGPFIKEMNLLTLNGQIAVMMPQILVNHRTLQRLIQMETITQEETNIASLCDGKRTPLQISKELNLDYEQVQIGLEKLTDLDIVNEKID